jgi:hypothetical protein
MVAVTMTVMAVFLGLLAMVMMVMPVACLGGQREGKGRSQHHGEYHGSAEDAGC